VPFPLERTFQDGVIDGPGPLLLSLRHLGDEHLDKHLRDGTVQLADHLAHLGFIFDGSRHQERVGVGCRRRRTPSRSVHWFALAAPGEKPAFGAALRRRRWDWPLRELGTRVFCLHRPGFPAFAATALGEDLLPVLAVESLRLLAVALLGRGIAANPNWLMLPNRLFSNRFEVWTPGRSSVGR